VRLSHNCACHMILLASLCGFTQLQTLELDNILLLDADLAMIAQLATVEYLCLGNTGLGNVGVCSVCPDDTRC
jgi:hypothetical protein